MPTTSATDDRKPIPVLPPFNWRREVPKYRISRETLPSPKDRFRFEPPFSQQSNASVWQYGERIYKAGEIIATTEWPCPGTMTPLNYSARQVMDWFNSHQKSRMPRTPWRDGQIFLDDGISNATLPRITAPRPERVDLQPRSAWPGM